MNEQLQILYDFIQQKKEINADEKEMLVKAIKKAENDFTIVEFKLDRTEKVKRTTAILLEETIEELEQKRKAVESTNRELEIESSLERVRTVAMGMKKPDDMLQVCRIISEQLDLLKVKDMRNVQTAIIYESKGTYLNYEYYAKHNKSLITEVDFKNHQIQERFANQMLTGAEELLTENIKGEKLQKWLAYQKTTNQFVDVYLEEATSLNYYWYSLGPVALGISTYAPLSEEEIILFKRFRNVFDLAYRRFIDIEKAEAQAREAEIELALERVRARTMAMKHSDELADASLLLDQQIRGLGIKIRGCAFNVYGDEESTEWFSNEMGTMHTYKTPREKVFLRYYEAGKKGETLLIKEFSGKECVDWYNYLCTLPVIGDGLKEMIANGGSFPTRQIDHVSFFKYGYLLFLTFEPVPEAHDIFISFAKVFEQTYTRFLDLQKAEAQAREAKIEAALERVRSRSMAMYSTYELSDVIFLLYQELIKLDFSLDRSIIVIIHPESKEKVYWMAGHEGMISENGFRIPYFSHPFNNALFEHYYKKDILWTYNLAGNEKKIWDDFAFNKSELSKLPDFIQLGMKSFEEIHFTISSDSFGALLVASTSILKQMQTDVITRFAKVFNQSYTRFLDLRKAEEQTKEAQIETGLERVRSRTLAMQKSDELADTSIVIFEQLINLGIEPNRLFIGIIKEETRSIEAWATNEDGTKINNHFTLHTDKNVSVNKMYEGWKHKKTSTSIDMKSKELQDYFHYLSDEMQIPFQGGLKQKRRVQTIAYFEQGLIGMASSEEQPAATIQLLERFAAVFNLTYTRFNDLKIAEAHAIQAEKDLVQITIAKQTAEVALVELQATQAQLIQSEKMASLGELTAGIAHEIQNPLNFVNNFSEVSNELIQEIKDERAKSKEQRDEGLENELLEDIFQNLEKINHHGKRADAIVKGMLQHSRSNSGQKEPTDINALADEYLRLAYHGLRAKDKSFNALFEADLDASIGKINIIPQDMGRVIMNLLTNAFYAVNERKLLQPEGYEPKVSISTKKEGNGIIISVIDNGNGIPASVKEKIFQPFFTTKPTGKGTGLGLSLSYDIVKAHGGEIKVDTKEGEYTVFSIIISSKPILVA